ncbi:hypothetical protein B7494_g6350 [Chlorociboria aeruginascens]|nr:hypothetical protein B7494_g6350 [Chlorociboria aeruginascens]
MPPLPSQKGTGKKGRDARQSRSRNTTPSLGSNSLLSDSAETSYLELPTQSFRTGSVNEIEQNGNSPTVPSGKDLDTLMERLQSLTEVVKTREIVCDRGMRLLAGIRKDRAEEIETERRDEEVKERIKRDAADEEERGRNKASKHKKRKDSSRAREERPLTHGAHGLAPQDGSNLELSPARERKGSRKMSRDIDSASSSLSPVAPATPVPAMDADDREEANADDSSSDEHQPPPAPAVPHLQTFGEDPSTFPDPTVYEIRKITPNMSEDEIREICSVADYPHDDLHELIPGTPPDKDFSNAKPTNQVQANTFAAFLEPYFRAFTEEDLAFLRDRGDRSTPFIIPRRGKRHYKEVWAEEDGSMSVDMPQQTRDKLPANQARGSIDDIDDTTVETDQISGGPVLSRLLACMRPEHRAPPSEEKPNINGLTNGEASTNGEANGDLGDNQPISDTLAPLPSATYMTESSTESWKKANHPKLDHAQVDERIKQELRHIGFLPPDTEPDYEAHYDDEVAARLRFLQAQLKEICIVNGARKARLMDLAKEVMAYQEYSTILEDLDSQVVAAYLKRTRSMGKNKKTKRPGGAGGGSHFVGGSNTGMARPGIGDTTKIVMERRKKWIDTIGSVFDNMRGLGQVPRSKDPESSIFKPDDMLEYIRKERESWDEEIEEE